MGRAAYEHVVRQVVEHGQKTGRPVSEDKARKQVAEIARQADRKAEPGGRGGERK